MYSTCNVLRTAGYEFHDVLSTAHVMPIRQAAGRTPAIDWNMRCNGSRRLSATEEGYREASKKELWFGEGMTSRCSRLQRLLQAKLTCSSIVNFDDCGTLHDAGAEHDERKGFVPESKCPGLLCRAITDAAKVTSMAARWRRRATNSFSARPQPLGSALAAKQLIATDGRDARILHDRLKLQSGCWLAASHKGTVWPRAATRSSNAHLLEGANSNTASLGITEAIGAGSLQINAESKLGETRE